MLGEYSSTWVLRFALWGFFMLEVLATTPDVCHTPGCAQTAERVNNSMDPSVDPCDDFYHFACGNYVRNEKPVEMTQTSSFVTVDNIVQIQLYTLLNNQQNNPKEPKPIKMARNLYSICLRPDLIDKRGVGFVVDMIRGAGGWPLLEGDKWDKFNWVETVYKLHDLGLGGELFDISVDVDLMDSFKRVIEVDQVTFGIEREYLIDGRANYWVQSYGRYMVDIARQFGARHDVAEEDLSDVLGFEIELAKIALSREDRQELRKLYYPIKMSYLQLIHPIVDWYEYLDRLTNNATRLRPNEIIIVKVPTYLDKLQALLKSTDNRTVANYLFWRAVSSNVGILTAAMRESQLLLEHALTGREERQPRWKECLMITTGSLYLAIGSMYVRKFFKEEAKRNAAEMVENIRQEMLNLLKGVKWMDEETRYLAMEKAHLMQKHVAYPNELLDDKELGKFYETLEITGEHFFESILNLTKFGWNYNLAILREPVNKSDWRSHGEAANVNAFYNPVENAVELTAGILQLVFFSHDRPKYLNYGAIGSVIAHEMTRGFDYMGQQFDKSGNLVVWWKPETRDAFQSRIQCVIDQANNYNVKSVRKNVNGANTQGQNAAEIGGLKMSYRAYNTWAAKHRKEPRLAGLEKYTPQQMFWLSAANVWCTAYHDKVLKIQMDTASIPPAEYRVNGAMRNLEAFAKDFQCPVGSNMNPAEKCNIW